MSGDAIDSAADLFLEEMARSAPQEVTVEGLMLRPGSRVRLRPRPGGDILDAALAGRIAVVEGIDQDDGGEMHVAVMLEDDPGRDLGETRHPAHRFFFAPAELEPLSAEEEPVRRRILVAGIGNVFLGDDGFGVAVAQLMLASRLPRGIEVRDYGIRGIDLAYALTSGYDAAILVDLAPRGGRPGAVYVIEPEGDDAAEAPVDSHQMNPVAVLALARQLGSLPGELYLVGCEPSGQDPEAMCMEMSPVVAAAVKPAAEIVVDLAGKLAQDAPRPEAPPRHGGKGGKEKR